MVNLIKQSVDWNNTHCAICGKIVSEKAGQGDKPVVFKVEWDDIGVEKRTVLCVSCTKSHDVVMISKTGVIPSNNPR